METTNPEPEAQLAEFVRELARHRGAVEQYRLSAYPEKQAQHELRLLSLYVKIGDLCHEHGLELPREVRGSPQFAPG